MLTNRAKAQMFFVGEPERLSNTVNLVVAIETSRGLVPRNPKRKCLRGCDVPTTPSSYFLGIVNEAQQIFSIVTIY